MPPRPASGTSEFTRRNDEVRERLARVIGKVSVEGYRNTHGAFAAKVGALARERDLPWFKNHKDAAYTLRQFLAGKVMISSSRLNTLDLAISEFRLSYMRNLSSLSSDKQLGQEPEPEPTVEEGGQVSTSQEIEALTAVNDALASLDQSACARVLRWANDKYGG